MLLRVVPKSEGEGLGEMSLPTLEDFPGFAKAAPERFADRPAYVPPCATEGDSFYSIRFYPELFPKVNREFPAMKALADLSHLAGRQLSCIHSFTTHLSIFSYLVVHVFLMGAWHKMVWSHAHAIVTSMTNLFALWDRAICKFISKAMGRLHSSGGATRRMNAHIEQAVLGIRSAGCPAHPYPTCGCLPHFVPEMFLIDIATSEVIHV